MFRIFLLSLSFCEIFHVTNSLEVIPYEDKSNCKQNEFFNTKNFQCEPCGSTTNLVPSQDHLTCVCNENNIIIDETVANFPQCVPCKRPKIPTFDQKQCIACPKFLNATKNDSLTNVCRHSCKKNQIIVEKFQNGSFLPEIQCISCANGTVPNSIEYPTKCIPCPIYNWNPKIGCKCFNKTTLIENTCVPNSLLNDLSKLKNPFTINLENGEQVTSLHLEKLLYSSMYLCKTKNTTACQMLANLCSITLYKSSLVPPCEVWFNNKNQFDLPWLYYGEGDAPLVLNRRKINAQYTFNKKSPNNRIQIVMSTYSLNGRFQEIKSFTHYLSKICGELNNFYNNGFIFGIDFQTTCIINKQLFDVAEMEFYNPFLQFKINDETFVYAIPVLITNSKSFNKADDMINFWVLVRRFFLIDNSLINEQKAKYIRYISSVEIRIKVRDRSEGGKIYPPYLIITYNEIEKTHLENSKLKFSLSIKYQMESSTFRSIEIAIGVLSAVAVLYSGLQTWTHSRRSGKQSIDIMTGVYFLIISCGNLANVFFIVASGVSLHSFIFYKGQSVIYLLLPDKRIEKLLRNFIIVSFSLKLVEIITLIIKQISIDIFLIDWEKPRAHDVILKPSSLASTPSTIQQQQKSTQQPVSIWRTYFIANEWNAIQSKRRVNIILHLILVSFTLEIVGLKYWATSDPELKTHKENNNNTAPIHISCLIAVGVLINIFFYFLQLLFVIGFYERFIKNRIQDFVDVCSLANISILILMLERYGFYIHGRSAHGFADTDMGSMITQLQREENNLCGHRGLVPETDDQTFRIAIPASFRKYYKKLIAPMLVNTNIFPRFPRAASASGTSLSSPKQKENIAHSNVDKSVQAYTNINKFLIAFFEHAIKDLDYEVRSPLFVETLFDIEFSDQIDRGVLYTDGGHSFDNVLFYGNELTLASFDLMLFVFISVLTSNYLLATFVTALSFQIITALRNIGGRKNLAKKTFIDQRFLI